MVARALVGDAKVFWMVRWVYGEVAQRLLCNFWGVLVIAVVVQW